MKKLQLEIDWRYAGYITPNLARTLEQAAQCMTLDQAENLLRAGTPRTWWAIARKPTAVVLSHIWKGSEPIPCAQVVERATGGA